MIASTITPARFRVSDGNSEITRVRTRTYYNNRSSLSFGRQSIPLHSSEDL